MITYDDYDDDDDDDDDDDVDDYDYAARCMPERYKTKAPLARRVVVDAAVVAARRVVVVVIVIYTEKHSRIRPQCQHRTLREHCPLHKRLSLR